MTGWSWTFLGSALSMAVVGVLVGVAGDWSRALTICAAAVVLAMLALARVAAGTSRPRQRFVASEPSAITFTSDTNLYRGADGRLHTDGHLEVDGDV